MARVVGTLKNIQRDIKKNKNGTSLWCVPNFYRNGADVCYDVGSSIIISNLEELKEYAQMHRDVMQKIPSLYVSLLGLYREKFSNLTSLISPSIKIRDEAREGKVITKSRLQIMDTDNADALTLGYIVSSLRDVRFRPYKEMSEILGSQAVQDREQPYLFPVFTENGIKTLLNGRNFETQFKLVGKEEADALRETLSGYTEEIATGSKTTIVDGGVERSVIYSPYQELVDRFFASAERAGRAVDLKIHPAERDALYDRISDAQIAINEMKTMEVLGQLMFTPDLSAFFEAAEKRRKQPLNGAQKVLSPIDRIIMETAYGTGLGVHDDKAVVVLTPNGDTEFRLVKDGRNLVVSDAKSTNPQQKGE